MSNSKTYTYRDAELTFTMEAKGPNEVMWEAVRRTEMREGGGEITWTYAFSGTEQGWPTLITSDVGAKRKEIRGLVYVTPVLDDMMGNMKDYLTKALTCIADDRHYSAKLNIQSAIHLLGIMGESEAKTPEKPKDTRVLWEVKAERYVYDPESETTRDRRVDDVKHFEVQAMAFSHFMTLMCHEGVMEGKNLAGLSFNSIEDDARSTVTESRTFDYPGTIFTMYTVAPTPGEALANSTNMDAGEFEVEDFVQAATRAYTIAGTDDRGGDRMVNARAEFEAHEFNGFLTRYEYTMSLLTVVE